MTEMRRLWVDRVIYDDHGIFLTWLESQGLSRFFVEVSREHERVLIDVHALPDKPINIVHRSDPLASSKRCKLPDCPLCITTGRRYEPIDKVEYSFQEPESATQIIGYGPVEQPVTEVNYGRVDGTSEPTPYLKWDQPLRIAPDTDPIPVISDQILRPYVTLSVWATVFALSLLAAFVVIRLWYMRYGCPFMPDAGLFSACKSLSIHVGK